jgi:C-terminal processing protease CtpA/Prc
MLRVAARFTGPIPEAVRLVSDEVRRLPIPAPHGEVWYGPVTVLVGAGTTSSGEVLAALLRRYAGAAVLGERTWGKDYVLRVEPIGQKWRALVPDARIEVPGERLAGGLVPDGPLPAELAASLPKGWGAAPERARPSPAAAQSIASGEPAEPVAPVIGSGL